MNKSAKIAEPKGQPDSGQRCGLIGLVLVALQVTQVVKCLKPVNIRDIFMQSIRDDFIKKVTQVEYRGRS